MVELPFSNSRWYSPGGNSLVEKVMGRR